MKNERTKISRRAFLASSACAISAPLIMSGSVFGFNGGVSPSNKINLFHIGLGNRGNELLGGFLGNPNYHSVGVCDCYKDHLDRAAERVNNHYHDDACVKYAHYEDALQRTDYDAIVCACPDHWHTKISIEACQAGKDVYCEKPLTLTLQETRLIVKAARKYNRVCTSGSQRVMEDYGYMAPILQSGAIGEVKEVFIEVGDPPRHCYLPEQPIPEGFDWDRWQGQAPYGPYNSERCSGNYGGGWRRYGDYGTGFLADWGAHKFAGALYDLGMDLEEPVELTPPGYEGQEYCCAIFKNGVKMYHAWRGPYDITFVGTEGKYEHHKSNLKPLKPVDVRRYSGGAGNIADDFAFCVRNRLRPFQDFAYGANAAAVCQLLAICHKLNRRLQWDSANCRFINDDEANRHVQRVQRAPYTIPEV
ncbi:MAG: Gfo/Idh/MocA family oxidoreductase [Thermoguttaceae bacterium]|nr:Gfo/Idh/MocA family oxidoreductase [Thermoguttaceae bacterium]